MSINNLTIQEKRLARLRAYKELINITYHELAEQSGIPESTVKKVMTGQTKSPRKKTVEEIEKVLGITDKIKDPDDIMAELMDAAFYNMEAPSTCHQAIIFHMSMQIGNFISKSNGNCKVFFAPLNVQLDCDDHTKLQPDILIVCDKEKLREECVFGAPDFVCEVLSPSDSANHVMRKRSKYLEAGVREYWEVNIKKRTVTVYYFEEDEEPCTYTFNDKVPVRIYKDKLKINFKEINAQLDF